MTRPASKQRQRPNYKSPSWLLATLTSTKAYGIPIHFGLDLAPEYHGRFHIGKCGIGKAYLIEQPDEQGCKWVLGYSMPNSGTGFLATFGSPTTSSVERFPRHLEVKDARRVTVRLANTNQTRRLQYGKCSTLLAYFGATAGLSWNTIEVLFCNDHKSGPSLKDSLLECLPLAQQLCLPYLGLDEASSISPIRPRDHPPLPVCTRKEKECSLMTADQYMAMDTSLCLSNMCIPQAISTFSYVARKW